MFDFNASLNAVAPVYPIWFSVYHKRKMKGFHLSAFLYSKLPRYSFVSVLFDFNESLNDVAPLS